MPRYYLISILILTTRYHVSALMLTHRLYCLTRFYNSTSQLRDAHKKPDSNNSTLLQSYKTQSDCIWRHCAWECIQPSAKLSSKLLPPKDSPTWAGAKEKCWNEKVEADMTVTGVCLQTCIDITSSQCQNWPAGINKAHRHNSMELQYNSGIWKTTKQCWFQPTS